MSQCQVHTQMPAFKIIVKDSITKELWEMKHHPTAHLCTLVYAQSLNIAAVRALNTVEKPGVTFTEWQKTFKDTKNPNQNINLTLRKNPEPKHLRTLCKRATENKCMQMTHKLRMHSQLHKINFISLMIFL